MVAYLDLDEDVGEAGQGDVVVAQGLQVVPDLLGEGDLSMRSFSKGVANVNLEGYHTQGLRNNETAKTFVIFEKSTYTFNFYHLFSSVKLLIFVKYSLMVDVPLVADVSAMRMLMILARDCDAKGASITAQAPLAVVSVLI
jgi:hypothetical protein